MKDALQTALLDAVFLVAMIADLVAEDNVATDVAQNVQMAALIPAEENVEIPAEESAEMLVNNSAIVAVLEDAWALAVETVAKKNVHHALLLAVMNVLKTVLLIVQQAVVMFVLLVAELTVLRFAKQHVQQVVLMDVKTDVKTLVKMTA